MLFGLPGPLLQFTTLPVPLTGLWGSFQPNQLQLIASLSSCSTPVIVLWQGLCISFSLSLSLFLVLILWSARMANLLSLLLLLLSLLVIVVVVVLNLELVFLLAYTVDRKWLNTIFCRCIVVYELLLILQDPLLVNIAYRYEFLSILSAN